MEFCEVLQLPIGGGKNFQEKFFKLPGALAEALIRNCPCTDKNLQVTSSNPLSYLKIEPKI
jgi:hypothetical protein